MMPFLFKFNVAGWSIGLPTYGTLLAIAFLIALWLARRNAVRARMPVDPVTDLWIAALVSGMIGAKALLYVLDWRFYLEHPRAILTGLASAGVFYGGLIAALGVCAYMIRKRGLSGWLLADIAAPSIAIGQAVGRLGCFAAGCCYGKQTDLPWAVTFTSVDAARITGVPLHTALHPSQLYLSVADLALFGILLLITARKRYEGQVFLWYILIYAVLRGTIEFTRGDPRGFYLGVSTSQIIAAAAGAAAIVLMFRRRRPLAPVATRA